MTNAQARAERANQDDAHWERAREIAKAACSASKSARESAEFKFWRLRNMEVTTRLCSSDKDFKDMSRLVEEVDDARTKLSKEMYANVKSEEVGSEDKSANDEVVEDHSSTSTTREQENSTRDRSHSLTKSTKSDELEKPFKSDTLVEDQKRSQPSQEEMIGLLKRFYSRLWRDDEQKAALLISSAELADDRSATSGLTSRYWNVLSDEASSAAQKSKGKELKFWNLRLDEIEARLEGNHADAEALVIKVEEVRLEWRLEMYWKAKDSDAARQTKSTVSHKRKHP